MFDKTEDDRRRSSGDPSLPDVQEIDDELIRMMLRLTPLQRLEWLQQRVDELRALPNSSESGEMGRD